MGIMGAMTTLGPSLSLIIAGFILAFFNWHALFWIFAGLSTICFINGALFLEDLAELTHPKLDASSVALISLALIGILYGISTIFSGNISIAVFSILIGIILLFVFIVRQQKLDEPFIDLEPLLVKPFAIGVIINMISLIIIFALNIILPMYMQSAMGATSLVASLTLFPAILLSCAVAPIAGKIYDRHGVNVLLPLGFLMVCVFTVILSLCKNIDSFLLFAIIYIPVICGSALVIGPVQSFALSYLNRNLNAHGITVISMGFQIAGCIGASLFTGIYYAVMKINLMSDANSVEAFGNGFMAVSLIAAIFSFVGFILALYVRKFKKNETGEKQELVSVRSIMKEDVYTVSADVTLLDAIKVIVEKKVSGLPVVDKNKNMIGFISDGDIVRYLTKYNPLFISAYSQAIVNNEGYGFNKKMQNLISLNVIEIASKQVFTVNADDKLDEVCRILSEHNLKKAPVIENGHMIGIINRSNITKYVMNACLSVIDKTN